MAPPTYFELGRQAADLFRRGYHPGIWNIETKTMTNSGIEISSLGYGTHDHLKVLGMLQSKFKMEEHGLTLTQKWTSDNWLHGEIMQKDKLAEGLMLSLSGSYQPSANDALGLLRVGYAQEKFNFMCDCSLVSNPLAHFSVVMAHKEFLGGLGIVLDVKNVDISAWKVALGWKNETATLHGELLSGGSWLASLFYKVNETIDGAVQIMKTASTQPANEENAEEAESGGDILVNLGMIYHLDENALIRAKINNVVELGLGYEQKLNENVTASVSAVLDLNHISDGNHKFGVGVALQC